VGAFDKSVECSWIQAISFVGKGGSFGFVNPAFERIRRKGFLFGYKNKNQFRPNLQLDGTTLSSLITIKLANPESRSACHKLRPTKSLLSQAKKATKQYNLAHCNQDEPE
jgi:hypothetical protein